MSNEDKLILAACITAAGCIYLGYNIGALAGEAARTNDGVNGTLGRFGLEGLFA